jgi:cytochrome c5
MKLRQSLLLGLAAGLLVAPMMAQAYDPDWKRGHVYYRMVCTECHKAQPVGAIAPSSRSRAEWATWLQADQHGKGHGSVKGLVSKQYRASIAATNKAAAKFADVPDEELYADLKAFLNRSAKDGDAPTGCR